MFMNQNNGFTKKSTTLNKVVFFLLKISSNTVSKQIINNQKRF